MCGFFAPLHIILQSQAAHLFCVSCSQNKAPAMTVLPAVMRRTFKSKIIKLSKMIPELPTLVMTLALVVLEQWILSGMGTEKPL